MKINFILLLVLTPCSLQAQTLFDIPPDTIKLNDSLYIDKVPVDNKFYKEFTENIRKIWTYTLHDSLKTLALKNIDNSLMHKSLSPLENAEIYNETVLDSNLKVSRSTTLGQYFNYLGYAHHPAVGISKAQAQLYCKWRTDMVNLVMSSQLKADQSDIEKVLYRLPTYKEYQLANTFFLEREQLTTLHENAPLKLNFERHHDRDRFLLTNTPEFTASDKKFKSDLFRSNKRKASAKRFTFFRCICEVKR